MTWRRRSPRALLPWAAMGLLILAIAALLNGVVFFAVRHFAGQFCGAKDLEAAFGVRLRWSRVSLFRRAVFAAAGPFGCYITAGWLLAGGAMAGGKRVVDDTSMRVSVATDGPAASAGFVDGDRIVSVDAEPIADWAHLKASMTRHPGEKVDVTVARDGRELVLTPVPGASGAARGKIYVGPYTHIEPVGLGEGFSMVLTEPARVNLLAARGWLQVLTGRGEHELMGPVGIVKATKASGGMLAAGVQFAGMLNAYFLWIPTMLALLLFPRAEKPAVRLD